MRIFKLLLLITTTTIYCQLVELTIDDNKSLLLLDNGSVENYLDSLRLNQNRLNHSYKLTSIEGIEPIKAKYIKHDELIYIDTLYIKDNKHVKNKTYQSLLKSIINISSEVDIMQKIERIESSYKFLQNSIYLTYAKTKGGELVLLVDIIPVFENNISGLFGANRTNDGSWIANGEIELYLENIWSTASNSLFHWKRLNEESELISFLHYEPTLWSLPFGLQFKFDKELRNQEYILKKRDFRVFSNLNRYGKWFFGSKNSTIIPTKNGYSIGLLNNKSNSILFGLLNDKRNHRWIPTNGSYWNISVSFGKQIEDSISNLRGDWLLANGLYGRINSFLSYHLNIYVKGNWVEKGRIHKGQKIRYGGVNNLRGYRDDQFISASVCIPSIELVSNIRKDLQALAFIESAVQKEYNPYPLSYGMGIKQVSKSSIISAIIGFGRGDSFPEAKLHLKFSSRL